VLPIFFCWRLQVVQSKPIEAYRNTFANLALPLFAMAEPIPAKGFEHKDLKWSIWDRWIIEGDKTVQVRAARVRVVKRYKRCCEIAALHGTLLPPARISVVVPLCHGTVELYST
jgi:ubiquitin-activating enzyme E1